ncbi:MAG: agmatinase [Phycisphaerales bacterium]|nr:MAG: agmatinase [Phycisphaerales bacterium]
MIDGLRPIDSLKPGMVAVVGVPSDENSSFLRGAAKGPARIRQFLHAGSMNMWTEGGLELSEEDRFRDLGDLKLPEGIAAIRRIEAATAALLERGVKVLALGGDHSITYPIIRAYAAKYDDLTILQLDAHPDLYDEYAGSRYSHACPFARVMEENLVRRLVQVGIRATNEHLREQAERFGLEIIEMRSWRAEPTLNLEGPLYLSMDMDVFDPSVAPGVSHHEPGGPGAREVLALIHRIDVPIVGADLVEFNPARDPTGITAALAAKLYKEIAARMLGA